MSDIPRHSVHHPAAAPRCPHCRGLGVVVAERDGQARLERCACVGPCPVCEDSGWVAEGPNVRPCTCRVLAERQRLFDEAGVPAGVVTASLDRWEQHPAYPEALSWLMGWRPEPGRRGLLLADPSGEDGARLLGALLLDLVLGVGARVRCVDLRDPTAALPTTGACRVLALLGLGDEPGPRTLRALERGLTALEDEGGTLLACTRHPPAWERPAPDAPACLAERIGAMSAAFALEHCEIVDLEHLGQSAR